MGYNRSGAKRKERLKRRRREVTRFVEQCAAANLEAQAKKGEPTDFTKKIRHMRKAMKLRS